MSSDTVCSSEMGVLKTLSLCNLVCSENKTPNSIQINDGLKTAEKRIKIPKDTDSIISWVLEM